jgi:hypothetical protein
MALSTSSNYAAGTNEFTVEKVGYVIGDHQQEFHPVLSSDDWRFYF